MLNIFPMKSKKKFVQNFENSYKWAAYELW